jgi:hypothetical protein
MDNKLALDIDKLIEQYNSSKKSRWQDRKAITLHFEPAHHAKYEEKQAKSGKQFGKLVTEVVKMLIERDDIAC